MEYAVPPANAVTSRNSTVSHAWMLMRRLKPAVRPSKSRSRERLDGRRSLPFEGGFPGSHPLRFEKNGRPLPEDIPHAPGGVDKLGVPGVTLDLLSQMADVHVDRALVAELVAPHPREQGAPREHPPRVGGERYQELELRVCQVYVLAAHSHPAAGQVDLQAIVAELVLALPGGHRSPAHDRAHPGHELPDCERLGDVIVGPELQAHDPVDLVVLRREHNDRDVALRPDPATHLRAVYLRQHDVQDEQVRLVRAERLERRLPISYGMYLETLPLQSMHEHLLDRGLIVHQQYPACGSLYVLHHI